MKFITAVEWNWLWLARDPTTTVFSALTTTETVVMPPTTTTRSLCQLSPPQMAVTISSSIWTQDMNTLTHTPMKWYVHIYDLFCVVASTNTILPTWHHTTTTRTHGATMFASHTANRTSPTTLRQPQPLPIDHHYHHCMPGEAPA